MNNKHPITPPPELVEQLMELPLSEEKRIAAAYRAGADQELEACCEWLEKGPYGFSIAATAPCMTKRLRAARRPKPPSLKEKALAEIEMLETHGIHACCLGTLRRAVEALPDTILDQHTTSSDYELEL